MTLSAQDRRELLVEMARHTPPVTGRTLTKERLCAYLGISDDTLRDRIREGTLPQGYPLPLPGGGRSDRLYWKLEEVDATIAAIIDEQRQGPPPKPRRGDAVATR